MYPQGSMCTFRGFLVQDSCKHATSAIRVWGLGYKGPCARIVYVYLGPKALCKDYSKAKPYASRDLFVGSLRGSRALATRSLGA